MDLTGSIRHLHSAHFYFQLGELISSTGEAHFAESLYQLIDSLVPVQRLDLAQLTLDEQQATPREWLALGSAGLGSLHDAEPGPHPTLLASLREMGEPLLVQLKRAPGPAHQGAHQCSLISRSGERRWLISLYRPFNQRAYTLAELALLKQLSHTLLPLLEHHAQLGRQAGIAGSRVAIADGEPLALQEAFSQRLARGEISLSAREQEVCLGLLTGGTVPQMAQKLRVKNSSVETYLKRAAAKLGISGRHGLAKWMAGA